MKKNIIFISFLLSLVYLSSAINITLNSGQKLESSTWSDLSGVLNKVDVDLDNLKINGKLVVNGKICLEDGKCLGECSGSEIWDTEANTCKIPVAGTSCKNILGTPKNKGDGIYWIKPDGYTGSAIETLCDMTTDGGGGTLISNITGGHGGKGVVNGTLDGISNLSTYGTIKKDIGTYLGVGTNDMLFKSGTADYIYSINNSSNVSKCVKGEFIIYNAAHGGSVKKLGSTSSNVSTFNYLGCNDSSYPGWRFGGNNGSTRDKDNTQAFNSYHNGHQIINGVDNQSNKFSVWTR